MIARSRWPVSPSRQPGRKTGPLRFPAAAGRPDSHSPPRRSGAQRRKTVFWRPAAPAKPWKTIFWRSAPRVRHLATVSRARHDVQGPAKSFSEPRRRCGTPRDGFPVFRTTCEGVRDGFPPPVRGAKGLAMLSRPSEERRRVGKRFHGPWIGVHRPARRPVGVISPRRDRARGEPDPIPAVPALSKPRFPATP